MSFAKMACAVFVGNLMFAIVVGIVFGAVYSENSARQARADAQTEHQALSGH